ncbi:unnamed protein product [Peniophora sp. CBMAI 1063]|nr:unnamed protein product [Peniophora sp. CBMAI 1063]
MSNTSLLQGPPATSGSSPSTVSPLPTPTDASLVPTNNSLHHRLPMPRTPPRNTVVSSRKPGLTSPMRYDDFMRAFLPDMSSPTLSSETVSDGKGALSDATRTRRALSTNEETRDGESNEDDDMPALDDDEEDDEAGVVGASEPSKQDVHSSHLNHNLSKVRAEDVPADKRTMDAISSGSSDAGSERDELSDDEDVNEADVPDNDSAAPAEAYEAILALAEARVSSRSASPRDVAEKNEDACKRERGAQ